ncbi:MAG: right-handed parallel beta-helix repeat-containing protein, partial [Bacteroidota bacterium]|nr:right-handed parallel beta-helix repeat-containing protein [Bacteroidota bacterium]
DSLVLQTNGVSQNVKLLAYGQDMKILRNKYILNDTTLTAEKPYLVYGYLAVDTAKTLTLNPGCKIYFHNNANLIVYGNLKAEGTAENPISMRGDRLDKIGFATPFPYNDVAGQWGGLYLLWKGGNHVLHHVNMNSGYVGIYFSNDDRSILPNLEISDCRIHNFLLYGLVVQNGNVQVTNTEISNASSYCVYLNGGKHSFIQSTIANFFNNSSVQPVSRDKKPAVMIMNLNRVSPMESVFRNCIISGSEDNEFSLATRSMDLYKGLFDHCYIRKPDPLALKQFTSIRWSQKNDTVFKSTRYDYEKKIYFDFRPDSVSPARGLADPTIASQFPFDLNGNNRLVGNKPDAGAYQWQPSK